MNEFDYVEIGKRIKFLRKKKGLNQTAFAEILGKSLRTVQKYEAGEIEVSIAIVNQMADVLGSTPIYILGYEKDSAPMTTLADVMNMLFKMEETAGIKFNLDVEKPPHNKDWKCTISFNGKEQDAEFNADICLFLEQWQERFDELSSYQISQSQYEKWKDENLAYYASIPLKKKEREELSPEEQLKKHNEYLKSLYLK